MRAAVAAVGVGQQLVGGLQLGQGWLQKMNVAAAVARPCKVPLAGHHLIRLGASPKACTHPLTDKHAPTD